MGEQEPVMASEVIVRRDGDELVLMVDGKRFPWDLASVRTGVTRDLCPTIEITLPSRKIETYNVLD